MRVRRAQNPSTRPTLDAETIELLQGEPELLAIADAIASGGGRSTLRRPIVGVAAAMAVSAVAVALALVLRGGDQSLVDQALAAVPTGRVLHVAAERLVHNDQVVDLRTGASTPTRVSIDWWVDSQTRQRRLLVMRNGAPVQLRGTAVERATAEGRLAALDPSMEAFLASYRQALGHGKARVLSTSPPAIELDLGRFLGRVELGPDRLPIRFRPGASGAVWHVRAYASARGLPRLRSVGGSPVGESVVSARHVTLAEARSVLGRPPLTLPASFRSLSLRSIEAQTLRRSGGHSRRRIGLVLQYGGSSGTLIVQEGLAPEPAYDFTDGRLTAGLNPLPVEGRMDLAQLQGRPGSLRWLGQLRKDGLFVTIRAASRDLALGGAQALWAGPKHIRSA